VPRDERHAPSAHLAHHGRRGRRSVRRLDLHHLGLVEERGEPRSAEDADLGDGHEDERSFEDPELEEPPDDESEPDEPFPESEEPVPESDEADDVVDVPPSPSFFAFEAGFELERLSVA
jgi:hypothetical protein